MDIRFVFFESVFAPWFFIIGALVLGGFFFFLYGVFRKEEQFQEKEKQLLEDYEGILTDAHRNAEHILAKASDEATEIRNDGKGISMQIQGALQSFTKNLLVDTQAKLQATSQGYITTYETNASMLKDEYAKKLQSLMQSLEEESAKQMNEIKKVIIDQTANTKAGFLEQTKIEFEKTQMAILEYKRHRIDDLDKEITVKVKELSEKILGKSLSPQIQQQLIVDALEKAKRDGFFDI